MFDSLVRTHELVRLIQVTCLRWCKVSKTNNTDEPLFYLFKFCFGNHWTTADDCRTTATGKTCMKWTTAAVFRSMCVYCIRRAFLLPAAVVNMCKLPVAVVRQSSAVVGSRKH